MKLTKKKEYILGVLDGQKGKISDALVDAYSIGYEDGYKDGVEHAKSINDNESYDDSLVVKPATLADLDLGYVLRKLSDWNNPDAKSYVVTFIDYTKGTVDCISTDGMVFQNINYYEMYVVQGEYYEIHLKQKVCKE